MKNFITCKSLSEALIFASTNPQYDQRLFIVHENCKLIIPAKHVVYTNCCFYFVLTFRTILVDNMFCRCCELLKKIYLQGKLYASAEYFGLRQTTANRRTCVVRRPLRPSQFHSPQDRRLRKLANFPDSIQVGTYYICELVYSPAILQFHSLNRTFFFCNLKQKSFIVPKYVRTNVLSFDLCTNLQVQEKMQSAATYND